MNEKIAVTLATLESHNHIVGDIERGVKIWENGKIKIQEHEPNTYWANVPHKGDFKFVIITFTRDGQDIKQHFCDCCRRSSGNPVCRHVVAAVLEIQGGISETTLTLGKTANATVIVTEANTAKTVGSGSLEVFATPMMIALMEQAACECIADTLTEDQTSVGTQISVEHKLSSPVGTEITATATIENVFGRRIEFVVTANDGANEIGKGSHTRVIVDGKRFMAKMKTRK